MAGMLGWRLWLGVGLGLLFWVLEPALHVAVFDRPGFPRELFRPDSHEAWMRLAVAALCATLGAWAQHAAGMRESFRQRERDVSAQLDREVAARTAEMKAAGECLRAEVRERELGEIRARSLAERIESILGASNTGLSITDSGHALRYVDPALRSIYGDPAGRTCHAYFMGLAVPCPGCKAQRALHTGQATVIEAVLPREGMRPVQVTCVPFHSDAGEDLLAQIWVDISGRKCAEKALQHDLDLFLDGPVVAFSRLNLPDWPVDSVSANVTRFGYRPEDFTSGRTKFASLVHPGDLARVAAAVREAGRKGRDSFELSYRIVRPGGEALWVFDSTKTARGQDGEIRCLHSFLLDTTGLNAARKDLPVPDAAPDREGEERLRVLLDAVPWVAVQGLDPAGTIRHWNRASEDLLGHAASEAVGRNLLGLAVPPESRAELRRAMARTRESGQAPPPFACRLVRKDGSLVPALLALAAVRSPGGPPELFSFVLDLDAHHPAPEPAPAGAGVLPDIATAPLNILLAEDNLPSQEALEYFLRKAGHRVACVANGREVLEALAREPYDLVLMDVQMPGMDGVEAVKRIRGEASGRFDPGIPVIALTAYAMEGNREAFLAAGMDDYVAKPIHLKELFEALARQARAFGPDTRAAAGPDFRAAFKGDEALYRAAASLVLAEAPDRLAGLRLVLEAGDLAAARRQSRGLSMTLGLVPAPEVLAQAEKLAAAAGAGDLSGARAVIEDLAAGQERFLSALARDVGQC